MPRRLLASLVVVLFAAVALAAPGVVRTKTGQSFVGEIRERDDAVTVTVRGIDTILPRDQVESIEYGTFEELFEKRLAALAPDDVAGRIALGRQAFDEREYLLAARVLELAMEIDPNSAQASELLTLVRNQLRLQRDAGTAPATRPVGPGVAPRIERELLTPDQVNLIRLHELKDNETVPIRIDPEVKRQMADRLSVPVTEFNRGTPTQQALKILREGDPSMLAGVRVQRDPESLLAFRQRIQPMVLQGCATSGCHGGAQAGDFVLFSPAGDDESTYTNFFILQSYRRTTSTPGGGGGMFGGDVETRMLDRAAGERSLLIQYGLPAALAEVDHPTVRGYNGIFVNRNDPKYRTILDWMSGEPGTRGALKPQDPEYGIDYRPPTSTQPASQPATE
jgi:hypothetical protein